MTSYIASLTTLPLCY